MKHLKRGRKFGRKRDQRRALLSSLAQNFLEKKKIITTEAKAKELKPFIEKLVTTAKIKNLHNQRRFARMFKLKIQKELFQLGENYKQRQGGYTRITKLIPRTSDLAKMSMIEFV